MNQSLFLNTLKTIGFPHTNKYKASDFKVIYSEPILQQLLDYICTFNENNALTSEELKEYASITPDELAHLENLTNDDRSYVTEQPEDEKREEAEFLKDQLTYIERRFKTLQEQKELLVEHQTFLSEEKDECKAALVRSKRCCDQYTMQKVPLAETKLSLTMKSLSEVLNELKTLINISEDESNISPCLNVKDVENYFEDEQKVINYVQAYLKYNFQFKDEDNLKLNIPGVSKEKLLKEVLLLRNVLKKSKMSKLQAMCNYKKKQASVKFIKDCEAGLFPDIFEASSSQLSMKLNEELKCSEKLRKKEELLISHLSNGISEHIHLQCSKIAIAHSNEILFVYRQSINKITFPLQHVFNLRSRLELLIFFLSSHQSNLQNIKLLIDKIANILGSEEKFVLKRKKKLEESFKEIHEEGKFLSQDSVLLSAYKILSKAQHQDTPCVTLSDVTAKIEQLYKEREILKGQEEANNNTIELLEKQYFNLKKYVQKGKEFSKFAKLEKSFSTHVNRVDLLMAEIHTMYTESENYWNEKNKLLETKRNLQLAKKLYTYALLDEEKFEEIIEKIKKASETTIDSLPNV